MRRGTTPTMLFSIPGHNLSGADIVLSILQGKLYNKTNDDMTVTATDAGTLLAVRFTQEETLAFRPGEATVQVNWLRPDGARMATEDAKIQITRNLLERVMHYGE